MRARQLGGEQVLAGAERLDGEAERSQQSLNGPENRGVVVDHSDHLSCHIDPFESTVVHQRAFHP